MNRPGKPAPIALMKNMFVWGGNLPSVDGWPTKGGAEGDEIRSKITLYKCLLIMTQSHSDWFSEIVGYTSAYT